MYSVIDIGTSSIKASVYQQKDSEYFDVAFESVDFRLVNPVDKEISQYSQDQALIILNNILAAIKKYNSIQTICIATYSLRSAKNVQLFLKKVEHKFALQINILTGKEEAHLIAGSVRATERLNKFFAFDVGGGSIEFNVFDNISVYSSSKNIGVISLVTFLKTKSITSENTSISNMLNAVKNVIASNILEIRERYDLSQYPLICTGGSLIIAEEILKIGNILDYETIFDFHKKIYKLSLKDRIKLGIPPGKADMFDTSLAIILAIMDLSTQRSVKISRANVRHGTAINHHLFL